MAHRITNCGNRSVVVGVEDHEADRTHALTQGVRSAEEACCGTVAVGFTSQMGKAFKGIRDKQDDLAFQGDDERLMQVVFCGSRLAACDLTRARAVSAGANQQPLAVETAVSAT